MRLNIGFLFATALVFVLTLMQPASAGGQNNNGGNGQNNNGGNGQNRPAPAPLIGASLPGLAIGYGVYWLIQRRRKVD